MEVRKIKLLPVGEKEMALRAKALERILVEAAYRKFRKNTSISEKKLLHFEEKKQQTDHVKDCGIHKSLN